MKKYFIFLSLIICTLLNAEKPEWVNKLPFTEDAFWGIGEASTEEDAVILAKRDILMQLSSHVKSAITLQESSNGGKINELEKLDSYFGANTLRGAEFEDRYEENNRHWVLMKYCEECGNMLMSSALVRYSKTLKLNTNKIIEQLGNNSVKEAIRIERRLRELNLNDYMSNDISVVLLENSLKVIIKNFLPDQSDLSKSQAQGLVSLSDTLLKEIMNLKYTSIEVVGHANPTGKENEEEQLEELSQNRAQTMADYLKKSNLIITNVSWKGGNELVGDVNTPEGMGKNRRVEIIIKFE